MIILHNNAYAHVAADIKNIIWYSWEILGTSFILVGHEPFPLQLLPKDEGIS
jgi:hypothetical protein